VFGNFSKGLHQAFGILPRVAEQSEESRFPPVIRMGLVEKIVEHSAAIDHGKVSVAKLHVARIVPRCPPPAVQRMRRRSCGQKGSHDNRVEVRLPEVLAREHTVARSIETRGYLAAVAPPAVSSPICLDTLASSGQRLTCIDDDRQNTGTLPAAWETCIWRRIRGWAVAWP
jgi:hypothetical protein